MRKKLLGLTVAAFAVLAGAAHAQEEKKVTIGVSIPAASHGWTAPGAVPCALPSQGPTVAAKAACCG